MDNEPAEIKSFRAELHLHTVLSPCAAVEMIPPLIIQEAESKGIDLIAVSDHNAIANISAVMEAARDSFVQVMPAIELQTREEIHSLCLFDNLDQITAFYRQIEPSFPDIENNVDYFGEQFVVDATGDFLRRENRLLISSSSLTLKEAWQIVIDFGGLLIPAHVNRQAFGLLAVLGLVPQDIPLEILEISRHISPEKARLDFPQLGSYHLIQNGDAHQLDDIMGFNIFHMKEATVAEIVQAIKGENGRSYESFRSS